MMRPSPPTKMMLECLPMNSQMMRLRAVSPSSSKCSISTSRMRSHSSARMPLILPPVMCLRISIHSAGGSSGLFFRVVVRWARAQLAVADRSSWRFSPPLRMVRMISSRSGCMILFTRPPVSTLSISRATRPRVSPSKGISVPPNCISL